MGDENPTSILGVAIRDLARLQKVSTVVTRHGFGELLARTPLRRLVWRRNLKADASMREIPAPIRFRRLLEALGPTYIKLGQVLSMRPDRIPTEYIKALQSLQDNADELPFDAIRQAVEKGLGKPLDEVFADFDQKPLATASIAQTHLATTHTGDRVVVKVQRPGVEKTLRGDLDLLYLGARVLEATIEEMEVFGPSDIVIEFEKALVREVDFSNELTNLMLARRMVDPERRTTVPTPYPELSSRTVLTMEYFDGKPLRALEPSSEEAVHAVDELIHAACKQVFVDGFFHADPHAGNLLVNKDGVLCMIDVGLMGRLSASQREDLITLLVGAIANDVDTIARALLRMGHPTERVSMSKFKAEIARVRAEYMPMATVDELDSAGFIQDFLAAAQRFRIRLATEYSLMAKAVVTLEGIIQHLNPKADFVKIAREYAEPIVRERYAPKRMIEEALTGVTGVGSMVRNLPVQLDQVLHDMETGNFQVRPVLPTLEGLVPMLQQMGSRVALSFFAAAMTICCAILIPSDPTTYYHIPFLAIACGLVAATAWGTLWVWHFIGMGKKPLKVGSWLKLFRRRTS